MQFQKWKKHYLHFQKWQKINFCTRKKLKTTKNAIFGLFSGAKIDFLPFLKLQIMFFCTFQIALFSNFRALWQHHPPSHNKAGLTFSDLEVSQPANNDKMRLYTLYAKIIRVPLLRRVGGGGCQFDPHYD